MGTDREGGGVDKILIGPMAFEVREIERLMVGNEKVMGELEHDVGVLFIEANCLPVVKRITLWHEVLHAMLAQAGYSEHDEQLVEMLSYRIVEVLQRNPVLREMGDGDN